MLLQVYKVLSYSFINHCAVLEGDKWKQSFVYYLNRTLWMISDVLPSVPGATWLHHRSSSVSLAFSLNTALLAAHHRPVLRPSVVPAASSDEQMDPFELAGLHCRTLPGL